jgi:hypothetical protein
MLNIVTQKKGVKMKQSLVKFSVEVNGYNYRFSRIIEPLAGNVIRFINESMLQLETEIMEHNHEVDLFSAVLDQYNNGMINIEDFISRIKSLAREDKPIRKHCPADEKGKQGVTVGSEDIEINSNVKCKNCGTVEHFDDMTKMEGRYYCDECRDKLLTECERCKEWVLKGKTVNNVCLECFDKVGIRK